jgi:hypothetical protein
MMRTAQWGLRLSKVAAFCGISLAGFASASAGTTTIHTPPIDELSQSQILSGIYGGTFASSGDNFTNGTLSALRVDDYLSINGIMQLVTGAPGAAADQVWANGIVSAVAEARYAAYEQSFGMIAGASGGSYEALFSVTGTGFGVSGQTSAPLDLTGETFRWARSGDNGVHSSRNRDNLDHLDHMVTYQIEGLNDGYTTWMLFFEDKNNIWFGRNAQCSDRDFNDLAIEIKAWSPQAVPLPAAAWMALSTLGGTGVFGGLKRLRRSTRA